MLVGNKTCRLKKKMSVGEFPLPKTDMSGMSGIPWNAGPKNGRGGRKRPREKGGGGGKKKSLSFGEKKVFCWLEKQNVGWKKNLPVEKKNVGRRIYPAKNGNVRNARPKNGRGRKKMP